jgi:hypothetical protein
MSETAAYRPAPPGFTEEQWRQFDRDGYVLLEGALSGAEVREYIAVIDEVAGVHPDFRAGKAFTPWSGVAHLHPVLTALIDHPRHVGFAYDLYGELLKLHNSQVFIRPPGPSGTKWHKDKVAQRWRARRPVFSLRARDPAPAQGCVLAYRPAP